LKDFPGLYRGKEVMPDQERKIITNIHPACVSNSGKTHVDEYVRTQAYLDGGIGDGFHRGHMEISAFRISGRGKKII
jgi:hypothetical protein